MTRRFTLAVSLSNDDFFKLKRVADYHNGPSLEYLEGLIHDALELSVAAISRKHNGPLHDKIDLPEGIRLEVDRYEREQEQKAQAFTLAHFGPAPGEPTTTWFAEQANPVQIRRIERTIIVG